MVTGFLGGCRSKQELSTNCYYPLFLHIVKNRNGERATIQFDFDPQLSRFKEVSKAEYREPEESIKGGGNPTHARNQWY